MCQLRVGEAVHRKTLRIFARGNSLKPWRDSVKKSLLNNKSLAIAGDHLCNAVSGLLRSLTDHPGAFNPQYKQYLFFVACSTSNQQYSMIFYLVKTETPRLRRGVYTHTSNTKYLYSRRKGIKKAPVGAFFMPFQVRFVTRFAPNDLLSGLAVSACRNSRNIAPA